MPTFPSTLPNCFPAVAPTTKNFYNTRTLPTENYFIVLIIPEISIIVRCNIKGAKLVFGVGDADGVDVSSAGHAGKS